MEDALGHPCLEAPGTSSRMLWAVVSQDAGPQTASFKTPHPHQL